MFQRALALAVSALTAALLSAPTWAAPPPVRMDRYPTVVTKSAPPPDPYDGTSPYAQPPPGEPAAPVEIMAPTQRRPAPPRYGDRRERTPVYPQLQFSAGRAFPRGVTDAWYGRAEFGVFGVDNLRRASPLLSFSLLGVEGWGGQSAQGGAGGGAMPVTIQLGYRTPVLFFALGGGLNLFTVDQIAGKTGVGLLSPVASGNIGLALGNVTLAADLRAQYRWQLGAEDRRVLMAGLTLGFILADD